MSTPAKCSYAAVDLFISEKRKERQEKNAVFHNKYFATIRLCTIGHTRKQTGEHEASHDFEIIVRVQGENYDQSEVDRHRRDRTFLPS